MLAFVWVSLGLAGCANAPPDLKNNDPVSTTYRIGPGDTLDIYVRNNPDLSRTIPVRPDGNISIPLVKTMAAVGKTPNELAQDLTEALSTYVRDPNVTVIVTGFVGTYADQVRVVGEASRPQSMPYKDGMSLLDVMIQVGGLTQFAAGNRAKLVRKMDNQKQTYSIHLENLLNGDINDNVVVHPGDVIIIPRTYF